MTSRIIGTGSCLPEQVATNDYLSTIMETSHEWIKDRTGISERHIAVKETTTSMAVEAGREALREACVKPEELDLIIVATLSADMYLPCAACEVQAAIGAMNATAFDLNAACSGFVFALNTAHAYLSSGIYKKALIIGAETLSKMMDWNDRSTCVLFGDGAGAAVLQQDETGIIAIEQGSDGVRGSALTCQGRRTNNPFITGAKELGYVQMDGQEVYRFTAKKVPEAIQKAIVKSGYEPDVIKYYIMHQANLRIIDSVSKRLKVPMERFPTNISSCGNISAGSVPVLLDEVNKKGMLTKGDIILLAGFGAGLTWGVTVLTW